MSNPELPALSSEAEAHAVSISEDAANKPRAAGAVPAAALSNKAVRATPTEAGADGNCFFNSLYEALRTNKDCLLFVAGTFNFPPGKKGFIEGFRDLLSKSPIVERAYNDMISTLCHMLSKGESVEHLLVQLTREQQDILRNLLTDCFKDHSILVRALQNLVATNYKYVAHIEVSCVKRILIGCGIYLDIKNRPISRLLPFSNRVVLYNQDGVHYQWFMLAKNAGSTRRRRNKRRLTRHRRS